MTHVETSCLRREWSLPR